MGFTISPIPANDCLLMACHITGVYDVNRNTVLEKNDYELVRRWAESVAAANLKGIVFHNSFTKETCDKYENEHISFQEIEYDDRFNPNVYRYFIYRDFLQKAGHLIKNIFVTDISDVVILKNPMTDPYFVDNQNTIFCGDEPKTLDDEWMLAHCLSLRNQIPDFAAFEQQFAKEPLLNCGIIGGSTSLFFDFIQKLCQIHEAFNLNNQTAYTGDMGAFNYLARTQFNHQIKHGAPVNTIFKLHEVARTDCWFRHK